MSTQLERYRLLNDAIGVYKKNFTSERGMRSQEQKVMANQIARLSHKIQSGYVGGGEYHGGLTTITIKSKM